MRSVDVHQHLLGEPLIEALARRTAAPRLIRRREGWTFRVAAEPDSDPRRRGDRRRAAPRRPRGGRDRPGAGRALDRARDRDAPVRGGDGADRGPPPGPRGAAGRVRRLGRGAARRARARSRRRRRRPRPRLRRHHPARRRARRPRRGRAPRARCSPASRSATRRSSSIPGPVVGPEPGRGRCGARDAARLPHWWPALTDYVAQMQAAWFAFLHAGRRAHPRLRVLFAMLAGGAPLQLERYAARRGVPAPGPRPARLLRHLLLRPADDRRDRRRGRRRAARLRLRPPRRRPPAADRDQAWPDPDLRQALVAANPARLLIESNHDPKGALA